jgi:plasmid maintenance system antidote protein VapI
VFTVRSIRGDWMRIIAKQAFPQKSTRGRIEALAEALKISRRSCYAYVAEERRVPEDVEARFIALFGEVAEDGWRTVDLYRIRTVSERKTKKEPRSGMSREKAAEVKGNWIERAMRSSSILSQDLLGHVLGWERNQITYGQIAMIEEGLDEQEARAKHPNNFDVKAMSDDIVATCKACRLIGAIDASVKEVNGMVFRVTCRTNSYRISE